MKSNFKLGLKHWTGTVFVALAAGFVIFGLLRGQEILNNFLNRQSFNDSKKEEGNLWLEENNQLSIISEKVIEDTPAPTKKPIPTLTPAPSPLATPKPSLIPASYPTPKPNPSPTFTLTPTPVQTPVSTSSPQATPSATPVPTPLPTPASTPMPTTSTPTPVPTPTPTPEPQNFSVIINEIAWMGTTANSADEWIELHNPGSLDIDISGWNLKSVSDGKPDIVFPQGSVISALGYFLIERTDDNTVKDVSADLKIGFGSGTGAGLSNLGEILVLYDAQGSLKDTVGHKDDTGQVVPWYFGHNASKSTMERIKASNPGNDPLNWQKNNGITKNSLDKNNNPINGTPRQKNSGQTY